MLLLDNKVVSNIFDFRALGGEVLVVRRWVWLGGSLKPVQSAFIILRIYLGLVQADAK